MEVLGGLVSFVVLAMLVEFVTDILKKALQTHRITGIEAPPIISLVVGLAIAISLQIDIFSALGFETIYPFTGYVVSGVVISAGSKAVHELVSRVREGRHTV